MYFTKVFSEHLLHQCSVIPKKLKTINHTNFIPEQSSEFSTEDCKFLVSRDHVVLIKSCYDTYMFCCIISACIYTSVNIHEDQEVGK